MDRFYNGIGLAEFAADPATPASGTHILYAKTDGKVYSKNSAGVVSDLAATGAGGGTSPSYLLLTSAFSNSTVTRTNVTGWSLACAAGKKYRIEIISFYQTVATATGGSMGVVYSGTATIMGQMTGSITQVAATTANRAGIYAISTSNTLAGSFLTTASVATANAPHYWEADMILSCTTAGTFNIQWGSEVAGSAAQLNAGSVMIVTTLP